MKLWLAWWFCPLTSYWSRTLDPVGRVHATILQRSRPCRLLSTKPKGWHLQVSEVREPHYCILSLAQVQGFPPYQHTWANSSAFIDDWGVGSSKEDFGQWWQPNSIDNKWVFKLLQGWVGRKLGLSYNNTVKHLLPLTKLKDVGKTINNNKKNANNNFYLYKDSLMLHFFFSCSHLLLVSAACQYLLIH